MVFDCPTKEESNYNLFSQEIVNSFNEEVFVVFLQTEIPTTLKRQLSSQSHHGSSNDLSKPQSKNLPPQNIIETYDLSAVWLLIGMFAVQNNKQVRIFTDEGDSFKCKLSSLIYDNKLKSNIEILSCQQVKDFNLQQSLDPWSQFENLEVLSNFEVSQLMIILKKFIKQIVTSKSPNNLEKLVNISQNLVKAHLSSIQKERYKVQSDLTFHFIRSLFLDNVLQNDIITQAILSNQIQSLVDFENFTKINYTSRFQQIIERIQAQIQAKQKEQQDLQAKQRDESEQKALEQRLLGQEDDSNLQPEQEEQVIKQAIQTLFEQYLSLFQKAKIGDIKKLNKLVKQIANYVDGFVMKRETAPKNSKEMAQTDVLSQNKIVICSNILRHIVTLGLIKQVDGANSIEHDVHRITEIQTGSANVKLIKDSEIIIDKPLAISIFENPQQLFKNKEQAKTEVHFTMESAPQKSKDQIDQDIEKLYIQMKKNKHFPNSLRELEKLIKKTIIKKAESLQGKDEDKIVESILERMNKKGMITQKFRTGESKQDAKDPKLKNVDILELFRKEKKEDIPIVLEGSYINK